jgi:hypothetical protein
VWRLGQVHERDGYLFGRLGYEASTGVDLWDDDEQDFAPTTVPGGLATPFAIRLADLALIFQTRKQDIRVTSFTGALRDILRNATNERWDIVAMNRTSSFREWKRTVETVGRLRFHLERPNPNYEGRPEVERLIESLGLDVATLDLRSEDGIDTDVALAQQMLDHVERGYGNAVAVGEREIDGEKIESVWDSTLHGESLVTAAEVDPETGEVSVEVLIMELELLDVGEEP